MKNSKSEKLTRRIKILSTIILCGFLYSNTQTVQANPQKVVVYKTQQNILLDGQDISHRITGFTINDENYFKLRDIANVLNETDSRFHVGYNNESKEIHLEKGKEYRHDGSLSQVDEVRTIAITNDRLKIDGKHKELKAYNINESNYYRLRDLGLNLDFNVDYVGETNTVTIQSKGATQKPATVPVAPKPVETPQGEYTKGQVVRNKAELKEAIRYTFNNNLKEIEIPFNYSSGRLTTQELQQAMREVRDSEYNAMGKVGIVYLSVLDYRDGTGVAGLSKIHYTVSLEKRAELEQFIKNWVAKNIDGSMSEYTKAKIIHDFIALNYNYNANYDSNRMAAGYSVQTPESLVFGKGGVCQAYTILYGMMLEEAGVESLYIQGDAWNSTFSGLHSWNLVKIDGDWYHVDVTWDDPYVESGMNYNGPGVVYDYFLKSDSYMRNSRTWSSQDNYNTLPAAPHNYN